MDVLVKPDVECVIPDKPLLRYRQRQETQSEIDQIDNSLNPMNQFRMQNTGDVAESRSRAKRLKNQLKESSPPELSGGMKDRLKKRIEALEAEIIQGMPSKEEMRKNPAGMVDRHMKWEAANKRKIMLWKNAKIMMEPQSPDKDIANIEILRPEGQMDQFRSNAQISGHMSYGNIPEWVWERIFEKGPNSALEQVKKVASEQSTPVDQKPVEAKIDKRTLPRTEEQKRELAARLASARAAKEAKSIDPVQPQEGESVPFEGA